jgi:hypothetical protein
MVGTAARAAISEASLTPATVNPIADISGNTGEFGGVEGLT